jgi:ABC-type glycerol-3-phosphate transport system permease component
MSVVRDSAPPRTLAAEQPRRRRRRAEPSDFVKQGILIVAAVISMLPVLFIVMTAVKSDDQYSNDVLGLPWPLEIGNFSKALHGGEFATWFKNSVILTGGSVVVSTVVASLAAFAIARMEFRGRDFLLSLNVALMVVPPVVMLIPLFIQFTDLGLVSTYRGVILIYAGLTVPFSVYLLTSFFRSIPNELFESATIDGASHVRILLSVVLPLARPALVTLVIVNALWVWNELLIALVFLPRDELRTLMVGVTLFQGRYTLDVPLLMAGMLIASLPMALLYLAGQRYFIRGLTAGAIKG